MTETTINLTEIKFEDAVSPPFLGEELELKNINFIFARNGSGKSTLSQAIFKQKESEFDIHVFKGFESLIGENEHFDAFSLAVNANEKQEEIKKLEKEKMEKEKELFIINADISKPEESDSENLYTKLQNAKNKYQNQEKKIDKIYIDSARVIAKEINPMLVDNPRSYNKNSFKNELSKASALEKEDILKNVAILKSTPQKKINTYSIKETKFSSYIDSVNQILVSKVEEKTKINRFTSPEKINFAESGYHIHKKGDTCAFCGSLIDDNIFEELETYFSADEVKILQDRITKGKEMLQNNISYLNSLNLSNEDFYSKFKANAENEIEAIKSIIKEQIEFFKSLHSVLDEKEKNLFKVSEKIELPLPQNIDFEKLNSVIEENNEFTENLESEMKKAKDTLRFHKIKTLLDEKNYAVENEKLNSLGQLKIEKEKEFNRAETQRKLVKNEIEELLISLDKLKPKAEEQAIKRINEKLRLKVQWELDFYEDENSGYYRVKQGDYYRSVKKLSTGEKNIIAFLYFIEKLEEVKEKRDDKSKIIVFDDPMTSNDDTMQYIIIWQLQLLYQGKDREKYDSNRDIFVVLTHNIHFYLNVQPHGNFEDKKGRTKYDKNNFYRIENHRFLKITSSKEDFKTSYEALWFELKELYDCGHKNSMLNSMRRIIETYMKFNNLNQDKFYHGNEQYLKLFNVNSHSIDDLSAQSYSESIKEMRDLFYKIFEDNGCEQHFKHYWKF